MNLSHIKPITALKTMILAAGLMLTKHEGKSQAIQVPTHPTVPAGTAPINPSSPFNSIPQTNYPSVDNSSASPAPTSATKAPTDNMLSASIGYHHFDLGPRFLDGQLNVLAGSTRIVFKGYREGLHPYIGSFAAVDYQSRAYQRRTPFVNTKSVVFLRQLVQWDVEAGLVLQKNILDDKVSLRAEAGGAFGIRRVLYKSAFKSAAELTYNPGRNAPKSVAVYAKMHYNQENITVENPITRQEEKKMVPETGFEIGLRYMWDQNSYPNLGSRRSRYRSRNRGSQRFAPNPYNTPSYNRPRY